MQGCSWFCAVSQEVWSLSGLLAGCLQEFPELGGREPSHPTMAPRRCLHGTSVPQKSRDTALGCKPQPPLLTPTSACQCKLPRSSLRSGTNKLVEQAAPQQRS